MISRNTIIGFAMNFVFGFSLGSLAHIAINHDGSTAQALFWLVMAFVLYVVRITFARLAE